MCRQSTWWWESEHGEDLVVYGGGLVPIVGLRRGGAASASVRRRADAAAGAVGQGKNDFKIPLARKGIVRALKQAAEATPQSQTDKRVA